MALVLSTRAAPAFEVFQKTHKLYDLTYELVGLPDWEADEEEDDAGEDTLPWLHMVTHVAP